MKWKIFIAAVSFVAGVNNMQAAGNFFPANHPFIQYFGRWNMSDTGHAQYSWPGVYLRTEFTGTSIRIRMTDSTNYFNVSIDGNVHHVFHGTQRGETEYVLAENLPNANHTLVFSRRNITFESPYSLGGFVLDSGATLLPPPPKPLRKIEFIGDSFTAAESNEATEPSLPWEARFPVTNIDKGFAVIIAKHFQAQYTTTCRSGSGMYCNWQGDTNIAIPKIFDRTLMEQKYPQWNFQQWIPDVVVICLGLNDFSGLKDSSGIVSHEKSLNFKTAYRRFVHKLRDVYPRTNIVAVAAYPEWIRFHVKQIVDEEIASGHHDIFYATFDEIPGGYVANGHPTVATHQKMADQIIQAMESFNLFIK
ncbi:MAG TPA: SGNH/GDSL hydrolase family protein [Bacteroidota bacterium]|nr:SGNH/GDSL hydrolase family protein [Bacteroidota bacterium]